MPDASGGGASSSSEPEPAFGSFGSIVVVPSSPDGAAGSPDFWTIVSVLQATNAQSANRPIAFVLMVALLRVDGPARGLDPEISSPRAEEGLAAGQWGDHVEFGNTIVPLSFINNCSGPGR